jgi:hypothetical protein
MPDAVEMIRLYHPVQQAWHDFPNHPAVIQDQQDRGWETPEDSAARAEREAIDLHGQELAEALEEAGLPKGGTVKDKQARLAAHRAEAVTPTESASAEDNEGEQG